MSRFLIAATVAALLPVSVDAATFTVINTNTGGAGSLAQAITDANATVTADVIEFNIPGVGLQTIAGELPAITQPLEIDGYTQTGALANTLTSLSTNASLRIRLSGADLSTGDSILQVNASDTTLRGLLINDIPFKGAGISTAADTEDVTVEGCFIGTGVKGLTAQSEGLGIVARGRVFVGGDTAESLNLISGNDGDGIQLRGIDSVIGRNLIGANAGGLAFLPNANGINILGAGSRGHVIGGAGLRRTVIAGNDLAGVRIGPDAGDGNVVRQANIHSNGGLGIDLEGNGPTPNDEDDSDEGPNSLQNAPELAFARFNDAKLHVGGLLRGQPGDYLLHFYLNTEPDPSGFGEGRTPESTTLAVTIPDGSDVVAFQHEADSNLLVTDAVWVSATARRTPSGGTSEFSRVVEARQSGAELIVTNTNDSGAGSLRAAILAANATEKADTIVFEIPGDAPHTITVASSLQIEGGPLLIDGYMQQGASPNTLVEGSNAVPGIHLDGNGGSPTGVLTAIGTSVVLRGLAVHGGSATSIRLVDTVDAVVEGCFVGTDGETATGSGQHGIDIDGVNTVVGGPDVGRRNVVVAADSVGILDRGSGTRIENNIVGRGPDATTAMPNLLQGIQVNVGNCVIGGDEPAFENLIADNDGAGIRLLAATIGVEIRGNRIEGNTALGIDLLPASNAAGVTENDAGDLDTGANNLQNFPDDVEATIPGEGFLGVSGTLDVPDARIGTEYTIRVFASETCDNSGHGEGSRFLGWFDTVIPADETFSQKLDVPVQSGEKITLTATDPITGNTSEFSACATASTGLDSACGDANDDGSILSADALIALRAAVGSTTCDLCRCDINASGAVLAGDAQQILRKAVGQDITLACPACD